MPAVISPDRHTAARDWAAYLASVTKNAELWAGVYRTARVSDLAVARARAIAGKWHLLALTEDWCGDAVNSLPVLARLTEQVPSIDLRFVSRDANPDLMDEHLTGSSRSIPVVIALDGEFVERAWWGPRPAPLQEWFNGEEARGLDKAERYRRIRAWYARDRGATFLDELLGILEAGVETAAA